MAKARRMSVQARRAQLVESGITCFAAHGVWGLSLEQLAGHAGASKALLLHYFGSKRGFFGAVASEVVSRISRVTAPDPNLPFAAALRGSVQAFVEYVESDPAVLRLVRMEFDPDPEVHAQLEALRRLEVERTLERLGVSPVTPQLRVALRGWIAFAEAATLEWIELGGFEREVLVDIICSAALNAIASSAGARA